ncbi:MAG: hypothetical protein VX642_09785 [Bdellovibrionota bacterium]|nr:hypothetical protein [Bdellovibrionota bacterium]
MSDKLKEINLLKIAMLFGLGLNLCVLAACEIHNLRAKNFQIESLEPLNN